MKTTLLTTLASLVIAACSVQRPQDNAGALDAATTGKGKVLVVLSGENSLALREGSRFPTGFYLNELTVPLKALVDEGYEPVFATPGGRIPTLDERSVDAKYFNNRPSDLAAMKLFLNGLSGVRKPYSLNTIIQTGLNRYSALLIPGGHAPMVDLSHNKDLGTILRYFHSHGLPTGIICHGPISLVSAVSDPDRFLNAVIAGDKVTAKAIAQSFIYKGYKATVFSNAEERAAEASALPGHVRFYAEDALALAGINLQQAPAKAPNVVVDRELVTGQNPYSDREFAEAFVEKVTQK